MKAPLKDRMKIPLAVAIGGIMVGFFLGREYPSTKALAPNDTSAPILGTSRPASSHALDQSISARSMEERDPEFSRLHEKWEELKGQAATPRSEEQMRSVMRELGEKDFRAALALAQEMETPRQRELFRNAALQGWAERDPDAACNWALSHVRAQERRAAVEAIAAGAVTTPTEAMRAFQQLIANDPTLASDHGNALVSAFVQNGQFDLASAFAASGPTAFQSAWLSNVYHSWAICQPQAALANLDKLSDAAVRHEALSGLFAGWASSDPAALVGYAKTLPRGETRLDALKEGLTQWVYRDSTAASDWMDKFDPSPDLDAGAAALAVMPALVERKPEIAASWAESITDPELRANTMLDLIRLWAEHDALGARKFVTNSPALRPETRGLALSILGAAP